MKRSLFICLFLVFTINVTAQHKKVLRAMVPDHGTLQFAGGIGFMSGGFGYDSRNKRIQADFLYGYVPKNLGGVAIHSITGKLTWVAIKGRLNDKFTADWLTTGLLINYAFGRQYFFLSPDNYRLKYYGLPTAAHAGIFAGGGLHYRKAMLYYELGTTDRDLSGYLTNLKSIPLSDIINIGIGTRYFF